DAVRSARGRGTPARDRRRRRRVVSRKKHDGPSPETLKLKRDQDNTRRALSNLKRGQGIEETAPGEPDVLQKQVEQLEETRERLSRLYFHQLEENRRRAQKLQHILRVVSDINSDLDPDTLLTRIAETVQES